MRNIIATEGDNANVRSLDDGLNGEVKSMFLNGTNLYVGGAFSSTSDNSTKNLNNVAVYFISDSSWAPLGAGVSGWVVRVVGMTMNITISTPEVVVSVNGDFDQLLAFGDNLGHQGVWVLVFGCLRRGNWLQKSGFTCLVGDWVFYLPCDA